MKAKRILIFICAAVLIAALSVSLTACLKIGMRENNVLDRLNKAEVTVQFERTSPMTLNGQNGYDIGDIVHGKKVYTEQVDGQDVEVEQEIYVFFTKNIRSADWAEEVCRKYIEENPETAAHWNVYRYDEVVAIGYFKLISIVKQY